jgi:hypothetical protein
LSQIDVTLKAAAAASEAAQGTLSVPEAHGRIKDLEREGDSARALCIAALSSALTTPVDREDIFRLSRSIDDVLDSLRDLVRELKLYGVGADGRHQPFIEAITTALEHLRNAVAGLGRRANGTAEEALAAKKAAGSMRRLYQEELGRMFAGDLNMAVLAQREILRRLDIIGLRLREAADALADGLVKRTL